MEFLTGGNLMSVPRRKASFWIIDSKLITSSVQQTFLESVQHAHLPYNKLINLHRIPSSHLQLPHLQIIFSIDTTIIDYKNVDDIMFGDSCRLSTYKIKEKDI